MTASTSTAPAAGPATKTFSDFGVDDRICSTLAAAGISTPFPIQELTLPLALSGADLIGQARTGTGKTLAFGIPMLQRVDPDRGGVQVLVIVPTRELCLQVADDLARAGADLDLAVVACYGGKPIEQQIAALRDGADVVVGTPGRLLDLRNRRELDLSTVGGLVLDEADEMLDLGFLPDVESLIASTADQRQTLLFSATMPSAVVSLARRYMSKPTFLRADVEEVRIAPETQQHFFSCHRMDKPAILARILQAPGRGLCVVFTRTKRMADILAEELRERDVDAAAIHSDLRQDARERALRRFRDGKTTVLVATEVAARGLDIDDVTHVVNYDCPDDEKMYLHRIGRTGRAGAAGVAITLAVWNELARVEMIKRQLDIDVPTHEVFSTSPILDELFDLPARTARAPRMTAHGERRAPLLGPDEGRSDAGARGAVSSPKSRKTARTGQAAKAEEAAGAEATGSDRGDAGAEGGEGAGGSRRRSRSGGRSRGGRRSGTPEAAGPAEAAEAPQAVDTGARADDAGAPEPGADTREAGTSSRRRVRRRAGGRASGEAGETVEKGQDAHDEDAPGVTPEPAVSAATASVEQAAEARVSDQDGPSRRTRVRRRVRQDERDTTTRKDTASEDTDSGRGSRRASPDRSPGKAGDEPAAASDAAQQTDDAAGRTSRRAGKGRRAPAGGKQARSGAAADEAVRPEGDEGDRGGRRGGGRKSGGQRNRRGQQGNGRGNGGGRSRGNSRSSGKGNGNGADRRTTRPKSAPQPDTAELRGGGSPRLDRPLVVTHLP